MIRCRSWDNWGLGPAASHWPSRPSHFSFVSPRFHLLSPASRNLFAQGILEGTALEPWWPYWQVGDSSLVSWGWKQNQEICGVSPAQEFLKWCNLTRECPGCIKDCTNVMVCYSCILAISYQGHWLVLRRQGLVALDTVHMTPGSSCNFWFGS